jgi:hypothetical protein
MATVLARASEKVEGTIIGSFRSIEEWDRCQKTAQAINAETSS